MLDFINIIETIHQREQLWEKHFAHFDENKDHTVDVKKRKLVAYKKIPQNIFLKSQSKFYANKYGSKDIEGTVRTS